MLIPSRRNKILIIDDEPIRALPFVLRNDEVILAHTLDQIIFWLRATKLRFDHIILDHDLNLKKGFNGTGLCEGFKHDLLRATDSIRIWSVNESGRKAMFEILSKAAEEEEWCGEIFVHPVFQAEVTKNPNYYRE